ncbi:MAG: Crp/Fnr family transcriptional regulator [Spirochaetales bacterium]|nr:Crp/Fnr family transcriptional regulator [Spirochaetales bacterium]
MEDVAEILLKTQLFADFTREEIFSLTQNSGFVVREYPKGKILIFRGDLYDRLLIVVRGSLSAEIHSENGKVLKIETLSAVSLVATGILYASQPYLPVNLIAAEDSVVLSIRKDILTELLCKHRPFLLRFMGDTGDKIVLLSEKLRLLQFKTISQKIASYLFNLSGREKSLTFDLPYSMEQLSELFGIARPSLSRVFSQMAEDGYFEKDGKRIKILDIDGLKDLVQED